MLGDNESEIELADRAVALNANLYFGWQNRGCGLQIAGLHEEALRSFECAMRLPLGLPDFPFAKCPDGEILRLGERESGTGTLRQAVEAYREALKERTRARVPLDWATTQNNLGNALSSLGERAGGTAKLEKAVAAYREALKERTRERVPLGWAYSTGNLGLALMSLAQRKHDAAMAQVAVVQIKAACDALTSAGHSSAGFYEEQLKTAQSVADRLERH